MNYISESTSGWSHLFWGSAGQCWKPPTQRQANSLYWQLLNFTPFSDIALSGPSPHTSGNRGPAGVPGSVHHGALWDVGAVLQRQHLSSQLIFFISFQFKASHTWCSRFTRRWDGVDWNRNTFIDVDTVNCPIIFNTCSCLIFTISGWISTSVPHS